MDARLAAEKAKAEAKASGCRRKAKAAAEAKAAAAPASRPVQSMNRSFHYPFSAGAEQIESLIFAARDRRVVNARFRFRVNVDPVRAQGCGPLTFAS